jgi:bifunctional non-homologous end joining protein LigD
LFAESELIMGRIPFRVSPMLATLVEEPFSRQGWVFEEKYDGVRILAYKEGKKITLLSRNGIDRTSRYKAIASELATVNSDTLLLDGEVVVFGAHRVSRFELLQQGKGKTQYAVFDCLYKDNRDLRREPLASRRQALEQAFSPVGLVRPATRLADDGVAAFETASERGLEGIVGKDNSAGYVEGRSRSWLKVKVNQRQEFIIGGFTAPEGNRRHFGALLLGVYHHDQLQYVGKVGTGFNDETLSSLHQRMKALKRAKSPFTPDVKEKSATFVSPRLVAEIAFTERTKDGKLRHPVYLGLRDDKVAKEVVQ